jgi:Transposase DDE domain/Transposase domain (DUF772)
MKIRVKYKTFDQISFTDILVYSKLPRHPFWSNVENKIDFSFADQLCAVLYSGRGQHPFAPSLKLKIHLVQAYNDLSDRKVEEKIIGDLFIKRFLGLPVDFFGFDHSTIGLDRSRMGTAMFQACHLYILAQMYSLGLWGDQDEQWILDSFPSNAGLVMQGAQRLIQQAMIRILQHLKRSHAVLYKQANEFLSLDTLTSRLTSKSSTSERMLVFSKLVAEAYALLYWFETEAVALLFWNWDNKKAQQKSLELQAVLKQILLENSRPTDSENETDPMSEPDQSQEVSPAIQPETIAILDASVQYEKIPRRERPSHRIISANDPEARFGAKNRFTMIKGFKVQNLCSCSSVVLDTRVIPASEPDRDAMVSMIHVIQSFFNITPKTLLGDTAYGYGKQRLELARLGVNVVAPVPSSKPAESIRFTYHEEKDAYTCSNEKETVRKNYKPQLEGWYYFFDKKTCRDCPLRSQCTKNATQGRGVFHSNYFDIYEAARTYNQSDEGIQDHKQRYLVERKNQELKNDCGLGEPKTHGRRTLQIKSTLAAIVVNLKLTVRRLIAPSHGFKRRMNQA